MNGLRGKLSLYPPGRPHEDATTRLWFRPPDGAMPALPACAQWPSVHCCGPRLAAQEEGAADATQLSVRLFLLVQLLLQWPVGRSSEAVRLPQAYLPKSIEGTTRSTGEICPKKTGRSCAAAKPLLCCTRLNVVGYFNTLGCWSTELHCSS